MKILTISIAAYNVEKYIRKTLDSLTDERIIDEIEIFVVDDGGTDKTMEITRKYAERYPQSIIPVHKENGGYGTTVNYSIAHATGKYFKLLDGDDWFEIEELYKLITLLRDTDVDVAFTPYKKVYQKKSHSEKSCIVAMNEFCDGENVPIDRLKRKPGMWGIVYKTEVLKNSGLRLPSNILYTDSIYSLEPLPFCKDAKYFDSCVYCYRLGREGQSASRVTYMRHAEDGKMVVKHMCLFYEKIKLTNLQNLGLLKQSIARLYLWELKMVLLSPISLETLRRMKNYEDEVGQLSPEIYKLAEKQGKLGRFLWICRKTNYTAFWILKLLPGGVPHHV